MKNIRRLDQYLRLRGDTWYYVKRVPQHARDADGRTFIYRSLDTDSRKLARQRRDICANADDQHWKNIANGTTQNPSSNPHFYQDVTNRAKAYGFDYKSMPELLSQPSTDELIRRIAALLPLGHAPTKDEEQKAEALLGVLENPKVTITQAMELYIGNRCRRDGWKIN